MRAYLLFFMVSLLGACVSADHRHYFTEIPSDKPHAIIQFVEREDIGVPLFGVSVAAVKPTAINGWVVDTQKEGWKLHAFASFRVPAGDTMLKLYYKDRDNSDRGFVRFTAKAGETYRITHRIDDTYVHFDVDDSSGQHITTQTFRKWQYVWTKTPQEEALLNAVFYDDLAQVQALLKQGTNPDWSAAYHPFRPISIAAGHGNVAIVKALIQAGADINPVNQVTPLEAAAMRGHAEVVELLLKSGAYPDLGTPLIGAAEQGHIEVVRLLLEHDAYTLSRNANGFTALQLAQKQQHPVIVELLKKYQRRKR